MNLLLCYPNPAAYSETFIRYHREGLQPAFTLTGGQRPYLDGHGQSLFGFPGAELLRVAVKRGIPARYGPFYTHFLTRFLRRHRPTAVLAEYGPVGCGVLDACQATHTPLVVHFHGYDAYDRPTLAQYGGDYQRVFRYAKGLVAVSREMAERLVALGAPADRVHFISCGVNLTQFSGADPAHSPPLLVAVGRFTAKKAPQLSIWAFAEARRQHPEARLVMVGQGDLLPECRSLVRDLGLESAVEFRGVQTPEQVLALLRRARAFVQHSLVNPANGDSEGTPTSILEASATGLPVVSTRHAGIRDAVVEGQTGFLVEEGDVPGMATALSQLLGDPILAKTLGQAGREKMKTDYELTGQIAKLRAVLAVS